MYSICTCCGVCLMLRPVLKFHIPESDVYTYKVATLPKACRNTMLAPQNGTTMVIVVGQVYVNPRRHVTTDLDLVGSLKAVQLIQQLQHGSLHFRIPATATTAVAPGAANAVHFVHENDAWCMLPALQQHSNSSRQYDPKIVTVFLRQNKSCAWKSVWRARGCQHDAFVLPQRSTNPGSKSSCTSEHVYSY